MHSEKPIVSHAELIEILEYSPDTGLFTWAVDWHTIKKGTKAGTINSCGYVIITIRGRLYPAHRLAWFYVHHCWPNPVIDHINRCRTDNRLVNLRVSDFIGNALNTDRSTTNKSGVVGVHYDKRKHNWCAKIKVNGRLLWLGTFPKFEDAVSARRRAELLYRPAHFRQFSQGIPPQLLSRHAL